MLGTRLLPRPRFGQRRVPGRVPLRSPPSAARRQRRLGAEGTADL